MLMSKIDNEVPSDKRTRKRGGRAFARAKATIGVTHCDPQSTSAFWGCASRSLLRHAHVNCQNNQNITCPATVSVLATHSCLFCCFVFVFCSVPVFFVSLIFPLCTLPCDCCGLILRWEVDDVQAEAEQPQAFEK